MSNQPSAMEAVGVTRRFGHTLALNELSFSVAPGQIVGLLGRNGAGKSTLLRLVSGQLKPSAGATALFGRPPQGTDAFSKFCLIGDTPDFGSLRNIGELYAVCQGLFPQWKKDYALRLRERFELPEKKALKGFSRGMQTALLLSVGLASGAELTVFDEPSLGLDAVMRERFYDLLLEARREHPERTFILSTHLIDEVARVLDYAVLIDGGKLLCQGSVGELTKGYLSVSGAPEAVRELTQGLTVLKEEELAGSLARYVRLQSPEDRARLEADARVQTAPMGLQKLFVHLTEEGEASRNAANA